MKKATKKVTQRVNVPKELKDIGRMLAEIGLAIGEVKLAVNTPPSNGAVAHSVEVSKRLDELRYQTKQAVDGIKQMITSHVTAFEQRLDQMETARHHRNEAAEQRIAKLEAALAKKRRARK